KVFIEGQQVFDAAVAGHPPAMVGCVANCLPIAVIISAEIYSMHARPIDLDLMFSQAASARAGGSWRSCWREARSRRGAACCARSGVKLRVGTDVTQAQSCRAPGAHSLLPA